MPNKFERENRYLVLKRRDVSNSLTELEQQILREITTKVRLYREGTMQKQPLQCVVVEHDWPEYEPTWNAIEKRVDANQVSEAKPEQSIGASPKVARDMIVVNSASQTEQVVIFCEHISHSNILAQSARTCCCCDPDCKTNGCRITRAELKRNIDMNNLVR